ncbi:MAG: hypothetical protein ACJAUG_001723 [Halioglobus sp.]|jgi:hypothetical protein
MLCQEEIFAIKIGTCAGALLTTFVFLCASSLSIKTLGETSTDAIDVDPRKVFSQTSPKWLTAVGKLYVPSIKMIEGYRSNHREDCSATLVSRPGKKEADTVITAWHCLEFYTDLSKSIIFTLLPDSSAPISTEVHRLADGGGMHADWAILRLHQPIPSDRVLSLRIHPARASSESTISMAGYSSDAGLGHGGNSLTYDPFCNVTLQVRHSSNSNCRAFRGASGGAVVQLSSDGVPWLSGVISQGDGEQLSVFIPVARFRSAINLHLR